ncbi:MAG: hypothetical protein R2720_00940 [Candidatus Nanopelagicales bacterium]
MTPQWFRGRNGAVHLIDVDGVDRKPEAQRLLEEQIALGHWVPMGAPDGENEDTF